MEIGDILQERYVIEKEIGSRDVQQTFLALDNQTETLVVIKLLFFNSRLQWENVKLFEREAQILKHLSHSSIPSYLDYFEYQNNQEKGFALVQSYINALSLQKQVESGRIFTETDLKQIAQAVLEISEHLHQQHPPIIHRDIKPSNILLANRSGLQVGKIYLIDFGCVQAAIKERATRTVVGTYGYMPPEQFGNRSVAASDLYSLGATIIYLASGRHPADLPQIDLRLEFENFTQLSPGLIRWLQKMTQPSLDKRFSTAQEALTALETSDLVEIDPPTQTQSSYSKIISKPFGSKVRLAKENGVLEIITPPQKSFTELILMIIFGIVWGLMPITVWRLGVWFMAFFVSVNLYVLIRLMFDIVFTLFGRTILQIDLKTISLKKELFGIKYPFPKPMPRERISKIERTEPFYKRDSEGSTIEVKPEINIWVGAKKLSFGGYEKLSIPELDWLTYEITNWLDIE